jgi:hypothetical protein
MIVWHYHVKVVEFEPQCPKKQDGVRHRGKTCASAQFLLVARKQGLDSFAKLLQIHISPFPFFRYAEHLFVPLSVYHKKKYLSTNKNGYPL